MDRKTRQAGARLRLILSKYGVLPAAARNLWTAIVQGNMLYASELTWSRQKKVEGEYQRAINRMCRATLGAFRSTPLGIVAAESGLTPARALLDHRQAKSIKSLRPTRGWAGSGGDPDERSRPSPRAPGQQPPFGRGRLLRSGVGRPPLLSWPHHRRG